MSTILDRLSSGIDPAAATPIYHQLSSIVRWEIAHGRVAIGERLPSVREVARRVGVNYHTVRRAWEELSQEGVVSLRRGRGADVLRAPTAAADWTPAPPKSDAVIPMVWVVGESLELATTQAESVMARWEVGAAPWLLSDAPPPAGVILALYPSVRTRWPHREGDVRVVAPTLSGAFLPLVRQNVATLGVTAVALVGPRDDGELRGLAQSLPRVGIRVEWRDTVQASGVDVLHVVHPARWSALSLAERHHPAILPLLLELSPGPLSGVAREHDWRRRAG